MGETVGTGSTPKTSWTTGLKAEFKKIIWPDQKSLIRQTIAVVAASVVLCILTTIVDSIVKYGVDILVNL